MPHFSLEIKDGKIDFDHALENMNWDLEEFEKALERFVKLQSEPFKIELWKQYYEWKRLSSDCEKEEESDPAKHANDIISREGAEEVGQ